MSAPTSEIYYIGIPNYTYGGSSFDALITLDASTTATGTTNTTPVSVGNHMDALLNMSTADASAVLALQAECGDLTESLVGLDTNALTRSVTFNVTRSGSAAPYTYMIDVVFQYNAAISYTDKDDNPATYLFSHEEQASASVSSVSDPTDSNPAFSVFMFYDAFYKTSGLSGEDIVITNPTEYPDINFFLVNTNTTTSMPLNYEAVVSYEYQDFSGSEAINSLVYANIPADNFTYIARKDIYTSISPDVTGYLVETESRNRKFNVSIQLFEGGSGFTGTAIAEINSTKLSY